MNKHILMVMDKESFTKDELKKNKESAHAAYTAAYTAADADHWIDTYFKETGENKQDYIDEIKRVKESVKAMDIDWSKTGCKFALVNNNRVIVEFFERKPSTSNCEECWVVSTSETLYLKNAWALIERPQPKSLFTQAMADNGDFLPPVGMLVKHNGFKKIVIGEIDWNNNLALKSIDNELYSLGHIYEIEPLTPPMTLIDGKAYQFDVKNGIPVSIGLYSKNLHRFILEGSQYDIVKCTNIQPLTVEVK